MSVSSLLTYSALPVELKQSMAEYLSFAESIVKLPAVDRAHKDLFSTNLFWVRDLCIPARVSKEVFRNIDQQFSQLANLNIHFRSTTESVGELTAPTQSRTLTKLHISGLGSGCKEHSLFLKSLLERTPALTELVIKSEGAQFLQPYTLQPSQSFFTTNEEFCTDQIKENLRGLVKLELEGDPIPGFKVRRLLQCSQRFTSISLSAQKVNTAILKEIVKSPNLTDLRLSPSWGTANYGILARADQPHCERLVRYCAGEGMAEAALISLISVNPNLIELDLSFCPHLQTDAVLGAIAEKLPNLRALSLNGSEMAPTFTDIGFLSLIRSCTQLQKLHLGFSELVTPAALVELTTCLQLEDLQYECPVEEVFLDAIATMQQLKYLELNSCDDLSEASLSKLQNLSHLRSLILAGEDSLNFTDEVLRGIAEGCQQLELLSVDNCEKVTVQGLAIICAELSQKRLPKLRRIELIGAQITPDRQKSFLTFYSQVTSETFKENLKQFEVDRMLEASR